MTEGYSEEQAAGYFAIVRENRNYRLLWLGEVVSLFGDWFNLIASASLVSLLTGSGFAVGGLFVVRMLAPFIISPIAGVAADHYNRKHLLIFSDLLRAAIVLGFLLVRDARHVWLLYTLTAAQLAVSGFFIPARSALLPDIVTRRELGAANALSSATWSVMLALGAAIGGLVAGEWGIYPAFVVDSLSFLWSAALISRIQYAHTADPFGTGVTLRAALDRYLEGLRYLRNHADTFALALHKGAIALTVNGAYQVVMVVLAERIFVVGQGGGTSLGLLYAVSGIGTGLGPVLARRMTGDKEWPLRVALIISYGICAAGLVFTAPLLSFAAVLFGTFVRAFGGGINWVFSNQLLFYSVPERVRGRVFSTEFAIFTLANAASTGASGWALDHTRIGVSGLLWVLAAITAVPGLLWGSWIFASRRSPAQNRPRTPGRE